MGWETAKFVDGQDLDGFNCSICLSVFCDPFSVGCVNEHLFCKACLEGYMRSTCPVCRAEVRPNQRRPSPGRWETVTIKSASVDKFPAQLQLVKWCVPGKAPGPTSRSTRTSSAPWRS
ncbi:hypothetical protein RQP46_009738 [Phenoliferia psychrophenolica]